MIFNAIIDTSNLNLMIQSPLIDIINLAIKAQYYI